ncbi:hypothetical protein VNO80_13890 [Phaseolus coccineus]|uniref:Uncharacterized protein n=1 Tax=Phaseolus coccineus TaxID=3886 RepID=A0AAN9N2G3_PHACN
MPVTFSLLPALPHSPTFHVFKPARPAPCRKTFPLSQALSRFPLHSSTQHQLPPSLSFSLPLCFGVWTHFTTWFLCVTLFCAVLVSLIHQCTCVFVHPSQHFNAMLLFFFSSSILFN